MIENDDPEIEKSPLSGHLTQDGLTLDVQIYRIAGADEGWSLEVINEHGTSIVWDDLFATDQDAYKEFCNALETDGPRSFSDDPPQGLKH